MKTKYIPIRVCLYFGLFFVEFCITFGFASPFSKFRKISIKLHYIQYLKCSYGLAINFRLLVS